MKPHNVCILGATGSIGDSTLDVIARNAGRFRVVALAAHRNVEKLADQCARFGARLAVIADPSLEGELQAALRARGADSEVLSGPAGLLHAAGMEEIDIVMAAIVGAAGLEPAFRAAQRGKRILLANKESLVIAGEVFMAEARRNDARILPVDSEHNAIFQSLPAGFEQGLDGAGVERIILTASGGPFLELAASELGRVTPAQACKHPNWDMGRKISVDSATLMNKGLEVIEARWLFNARPDQIEVLIHPQSIVHSMVSYRDGSILAQMGTPDMRTPIAHALAWPERIDAGVERLDLARMNDLEFRQPDLERFPCLGLAFEAMRRGDSAPAALNAANEVAVEYFLEGRLGFDRIPQLVAAVMDRVAIVPLTGLEDVLEQDRTARRIAQEHAVTLQ
ncbi:1-deoxy-D-xylulose-5-phosphate reductoisomerase [Pseudomonadota bacterium]|jgi:1-deoxy-D-xylulose-5-phosphate reductoisomerase|nr:1-deoxy-D-xylulose-5-phosphate reductoisomerase [Xanthomonadales bacterium]